MNDRDRYWQAMSRRPWLYISGPMRGKWGDSPWINCNIGIRIAHTAWAAGWHPVCPQLNGFWEMVVGALDNASTDGASGWLDYDFSFLTRCDALYRYPGESVGADREVALMEMADKVVIPGPAEPSLVEFPRPQDYLDYVGGVWMRKRTGVITGAVRSEGMRY